MTPTEPDIFLANGARFLAEHDMIVAHIRKGKGWFEPVTTEWMFERADQRGYVDVGASTGWFAVPMAMRGIPTLAFEPLPNSYQRLLDNAALNPPAAENLLTINKAVSSSTGMAVLEFNPRLPLTSGASLEPNVGGNKDRTQVLKTSLDDADIGDVSLLKVDVEGHERAVLAGADKLIARCRPYMVLEANTLGHAEILYEWLRDHDYEWELADRRNLLCSPQ